MRTTSIPSANRIKALGENARLIRNILVVYVHTTWSILSCVDVNGHQRGRRVLPHAITYTVVQEDIYGLVKIRHDFITTIEWTFMSTQRGAKVMNNLVYSFLCI